jgi:2-isopropylmalate synthase
MNFQKYRPSYSTPPVTSDSWVKKAAPSASPVWCSVDLRDGNQALITPMTAEEKLEYLKLLINIGFKEIEVGFPAASNEEFNFVSSLSVKNRNSQVEGLQDKNSQVEGLQDSNSHVEGLRDNNCSNNYSEELNQNKVNSFAADISLPDEVWIQVISDWRPAHINRTFEALSGFKNIIFHFFSTVSDTFRVSVLSKPREEILSDICETAEYVRSAALKFLRDNPETNIKLEYSPEGFTDTDPEFALKVINSVLNILLPEFAGRLIINIPSTVENSLPHVFASQIEYISKNMICRDKVTLSVHPHNDKGCAVAAAELALLAGADRIEGTLFGNGERTGNVDICTLALNLFSDGINPVLDFSNLPYVRSIYEKLTGFTVPMRYPYAGDLVFTALTATHQNAIAKAMSAREKLLSKENLTDNENVKKVSNDDEDNNKNSSADNKENNKDSLADNKNRCNNYWNVPYLPIDPTDIGRTYESDIIKINSISGKGGVSYILKTNFGFILPEKMKSDVSNSVKEVMDASHLELSADRVYEIFENKYIKENSIFTVPACHFRQIDGIYADVTIHYNHENYTITSGGNGRLDATSNAIKQFFGLGYELSVYEEHALSNGSSASAAAYVGVLNNDRLYWGVGIDSDIIKASVSALAVAVNAILKSTDKVGSMTNLMVLIMNYIKNNYATVTLDDLVNSFHFTKPYLSKYIKENTGRTFGDIVRELRMKKACDMLENTKMTVELIAQKSGYPTPEHFNRLFKKIYGMTPLQYKNKHFMLQNTH